MPETAAKDPPEESHATHSIRKKEGHEYALMLNVVIIKIFAQILKPLKHNNCEKGEQIKAPPSTILLLNRIFKLSRTKDSLC